MRRALTADQTRDLERRVMGAHGLSVAELTDLAGEAVAGAAVEMTPVGPVTVLAGSGNNAGDGWVAARLLLESGRAVSVHSLVEPRTLPEPARAAAARAMDAGVGVSTSLPTALRDAALVVDALYGFGVHGPLREPASSWVDALAASGTPVLSVDLPSGVVADTGAAHGAAVRADRTLAVLALKAAHVQEPGASLSGDVVVADLGMPQEQVTPSEGLEVWDASDVAAVLPAADPQDHKGSRGRVLVVGGSAGMAGSVALSALAALRTGAGYVSVACPASLTDAVNVIAPAAVAIPLPETGSRALARESAQVAAALASRADAVLLGPGLGASDEARDVAMEVAGLVEAPLVLDADGLNAHARRLEELAARRAATVLTPHPGEAARLLGVGIRDVQDERLAAAERLSGDGFVAVLKGAGTLVAGTGRMGAVTTGTPALATMGTGDVLAGMLAALLAQGVAAFDASMAAAYLHGVAGVVGAEALTERGLTARDLVDHVPAALTRVAAAAE